MNVSKNFPTDEPTPTATEEPDHSGIFRDALTEAVGRITTNLAVLPRSRHPEPVHQTRVGLRRFRSILQAFAPLFVEDWRSDLRTETKRLASSLGRVRDIDVMLGRLHEKITDLPVSDREIGAQIVGKLERARGAAQRDLRSLTQDDATKALVERLVQSADEPKLLGPVTAAELTAFAAERWRTLRTAVDEMSSTPTADELHRVRILTKRARYVVEAIVPVAGKDAEGFVEAAADVQTVLGELQDAEVTQSWLREIATSRDVAFVAGGLAQREREAAERACRKWSKAWKGLNRKKLTRWMEA